MRHLKSIVVALLSCFVLSGCILESDKWYDYGNGKINLKNINFIKPVIQATLSLSDGPLKEIGVQFTEPLTEENATKYKSFLTKENTISSDFYAIQIHTYVMFDAFKLDLFDSDMLIKRPEKYSVNDFMLKKIKDQGVPENAIERLKTNSKDQIFDRDGFIKFLGTNDINLDNYWVKEVLINTGLGEKGYKFIEKYGINSKDKDSEHLASENDLTMFKSKIDYSIKSYKNIPAN